MSDKRAEAPSSGQAWWAVFVLFVASTFSYIDRYVIALMVGPLKAEFHLSDSQIGLLNGAAFAVFYVLMSLPIAWLADRKSRRMILSIGITIWCAATTLSGFAQNYWQLFVARMGLGVGESVLSPSAFSLIADLFPKEKRGFAYGVFGMGVAIGGGLALIAGASVTYLVGDGIDTFLGHLKGWQVVFIAIGLPGFLVAILAMTMVEPRHSMVKPPPPPKGELPIFLKKNAYMMSLMFVSFSLAGMIATGFTAWGPTFYVRSFNLSNAEAGWALGISMMVFAPLGGVFGGWLIKYFTQRGRLDAPILVALIGQVTQTPFKFFAVQMPTWELAVVMQGVAYFFGALPYLAGAAALQLFTPNTLRSQVAALYFFAVTVIAIVLGPYIVGFMTDFVFGREAALAQSLYTTVGIFAPVMIVLMILVLKPYRRAVAEFEAAGGK